MLLERFFSRLDEGPGGGDSGLRAFQRVLVLVIATEYWTKAIRDRALFDAVDGVALTLVTGLAAVVLHGRYRRAGLAGIALLQAWWILRYFPLTGNHRYLELVFALLLGALDDRRADHRTLQLRGIRWSVIVVFFYSGLQKLFWGYWTGGQFLGYSLGREPFRSTLGSLVPAHELARLTGLSMAIGDGPYLPDAPLLILAGNLTWIAEIALALALFFPARRRTWPVACLIVMGIELVAREMMFGVEFCAALTLFARGDLLTRWLRPIAVFLGLLLLVRLGVLPEVLFY